MRLHTVTWLCRNSLPAQLHAVRDGWRHHQWCSFVRQGRRETRELRGVLVGVFFATDFDETRSFMSGSAAARSVSLLATASPATFHDRADSTVVGLAVTSTWKHVAWTCRCRLSHAQRLPARDLSPIQLRLGWVRKQSREQDLIAFR